MEEALIIHPTMTVEEDGSYQKVISDITKTIYLGSIASRKKIAAENFEWIVEILSKDEVAPIPPPSVKRIYRFEFEDVRSVNLEEWTNKILPILQFEEGKGLIHCREGRSRSPAILIAYLIKYEHKSYEAALEYLRSARPIVKPNVGFERQLRQMAKDVK